MTRTTDDHRALASKLLSSESGGSTDERAAASRMFERMFAEIEPIVGESGVIAIFARSVIVAKADYEGLAPLVLSIDSLEAVVECLRQHFDTVPERHVRDGAIGLSNAFLSLMSRLVGVTLTVQIIQHAWPAVDLAKESK